MAARDRPGDLLRSARQATPPARADRPSPGETLLLRAALSHEREAARAAWSAWSEHFPDGSEPRNAARLLPLACRNLASLDVEPEPRLKAAYLRALGSNSRILHVAGEALATLADAGVETLALKGTALLLLHYRDRGARPMSDLDLLVRPSQAAAAVAALKAAGWRGGELADWLRSGMHAGVLGRGAGATLDLHWHASYEARFPSADDDFWAGAQPLVVAGQPTQALNATDQLLHSVVHGLRWSIAPSSVWIADAAVILRGGTVDPERAVSQAAGLRLTWALRQGLEVVRSVVGQEPELDALLARLRRERTSWKQRLEQAYRVRSPAGVLGALPNLWFAYERQRPREGAPGPGFAAFLANVWGLAGVRALPSAVARKALRRLRFVAGWRRRG